MDHHTKFTVNWKRSAQTRKQRKFLHRAPLHVKQKLMHAHLSPQLREKYSGTRSIQLRKGDKVKVLRGEFRKKEGKIERVQLKLSRVYVSGLDRIKADGSKIAVAFHPSNLLLIDLDLSDKKRKNKLAKKSEAAKLSEQVKSP